jgi:anaerobic dimethyl sulfoxide reductase subunit B (iron-sulfur subunit)
VSGRLGFLVDSTRCINCRTCEIACKDANGAALGQRPRRVRTWEGGEWPRPVVANLSLSCMHCDHPQCLAGCPAGAYRKRADGIVLHDPGACIGCQYCTWNCPYGAPQYDPEAGRVMKCDMCADRQDAGENPACVDACPMRAIEVGILAELEQRSGVVPEIVGLPDPSLPGPCIRFRARPEIQTRL